MKVYSNVTEMIGKTPLLRLERIAENRQVYAKCEFMNPISIKDRPILQIIDDAEVEGGSNVSIHVVERKTIYFRAFIELPTILLEQPVKQLWIGRKFV